jgi:hypothetical protein
MTLETRREEPSEVVADRSTECVGYARVQLSRLFSTQVSTEHMVPPWMFLKDTALYSSKLAGFQNLEEEFRELRCMRRETADDVILSNLLTKQGIKLKTVFTPSVT